MSPYTLVRNILIVLTLGGSANEFLGGLTFDGDGRVVAVVTSASPDFESGEGVYLWTYDPRTGEEHVEQMYTGANATTDIAVADNGFTCASGVTTSNEIFQTTAGVVQETKNAGTDATLACQDADGSNRRATLLGGNGNDVIHAVDILENDNVVVAGHTTSDDLPTTANAIDTVPIGGEAFIAILSFDLTSVLYLTYLGGNGSDVVADLVVDDSSIVVTGRTEGLPFGDAHLISDSPALVGTAGFAVWLNVTENVLSYVSSMLFDGEGTQAFSTIDKEGDCLLLGGWSAGATSLPGANGHDVTAGAQPRGFVVKVTTSPGTYNAGYVTFSGNNNGPGGVGGVAFLGGGYVVNTGWSLGDNSIASGPYVEYIDIHGTGAESLDSQENLNEDPTDANRVAVDTTTRYIALGTHKDLAGAARKATGSQAQSDVEITILSYKLDLPPTAIEASTRSDEAGNLNGVLAYPNPASTSVGISFELATYAEVQIELYDLRGKRIGVQTPRRLPSGRHDENLDLPSLAAGIYFLSVRADAERVLHKVAVVH
jgi:hypothetical protein